MAGSLAHITLFDGSFDPGLIENMRDAEQALVECHQIIAMLLTAFPDPAFALKAACAEMSFPVPANEEGPVVPALLPAYWGGNQEPDAFTSRFHASVRAVQGRGEPPTGGGGGTSPGPSVEALAAVYGAAYASSLTDGTVPDHESARNDAVAATHAFVADVGGFRS